MNSTQSSIQIGLLYSDSGWSSDGDLWAGIADASGALLGAYPLHSNETSTDTAELAAVCIACDFIAHRSGVIVTDSLTTVKAVGRERGYTRVPRSADYTTLRDAIRAKLPDGWRVAWVPRELNLADRALAAELRKPPRTEDWAHDDGGKLIIYGTCQRPAGHPERMHQEWRDGKLWAEWSGPVERAPREETP